MKWTNTAPQESGWYWWRSGPERTTVATYVDSHRLTKLFQSLHSIHVANIGGQWCKMSDPPK